MDSNTQCSSCSNGHVWYALITFLYVDILGVCFVLSLKNANSFDLTIDTTGYIAILLQPADQIY
jgi:hypothetical protein